MIRPPARRLPSQPTLTTTRPAPTTIATLDPVGGRYNNYTSVYPTCSMCLRPKCLPLPVLIPKLGVLSWLGELFIPSYSCLHFRDWAEELYHCSSRGNIQTH